MCFYHILSHILKIFIKMERYASFTTFYLIPEVSYQYSRGECMSISKWQRKIVCDKREHCCRSDQQARSRVCGEPEKSAGPGWSVRTICNVAGNEASQRQGASSRWRSQSCTGRSGQSSLQKWLLIAAKWMPLTDLERQERLCIKLFFPKAIFLGCWSQSVLIELCVSAS